MKYGQKHSSVTYVFANLLHLSIRPAVEAANEYAPAHSRIFKEVCMTLISRMSFMVLLCSDDSLGITFQTVLLHGQENG